MNKTFTIIVAIMLSLLLVGSAFAGGAGTMKKGSWFMAGGWTAGFSSAGGDLNKGGPDGKSITYINFSPCLGYFFMDALGIGALIDFNNMSQGDYKNTAIGIGPKAYYYIGAGKNDIAKGKAVPYVTAAFTYVTETSKNTIATVAYESKGKGYDVHFGLGGIYMLANSFGVYGEAFYNMESRKSKPDKDAEWSKSVSGNELGLMIGVNAFFSFGE